MVVRAEQPAGVAVYGFVSGEFEDGEELVAIWVVGFLSGIVAADFVFVVAIESKSRAGRTVFRKAVWGVFRGFVKHYELGAGCGLAWLAEITPEAGFLDVVAAAVEEVTSGFVGDGAVPFLLGGAAHVWRAAVTARACALAEEIAQAGDQRPFEFQHAQIYPCGGD